MRRNINKKINAKNDLSLSLSLPNQIANKKDFSAEQRLIWMTPPAAGEAPPAAQQETPEQKAENTVKELDADKLRGLKGDELVKKANEIVDRALGDNKDKAEKKVGLLEITLKQMADKLGLSLDQSKAQPEITAAKEKYAKSVADAKAEFDERMQDFHSQAESYGGTAEDGILNLDDDIANAPDGSETKNAYDAFIGVQNQLDTAKTKVNQTNSTIDKANLNSEVAELETKLAETKTNLEAAIKTDFENAQNQNSELGKAYGEAFESHLEGERDTKAIENLQKEYADKLPAGFDFKNANKEIKNLTDSIKKIGDNYEKVKGYFTTAPNKPFQGWDELVNALEPEQKEKLGKALPADQQKVLESVNNAIILNNLQEYKGKERAVLDDKSEPEKSATPIAETAPTADPTAEKKEGLPAIDQVEAGQAIAAILKEANGINKFLSDEYSKDEKSADNWRQINTKIVQSLVDGKSIQEPNDKTGSSAEVMGLIKKIQKELGVKEDGMVGPETLKALFPNAGIKTEKKDSASTTEKSATTEQVIDVNQLTGWKEKLGAGVTIVDNTIQAEKNGEEATVKIEGKDVKVKAFFWLQSNDSLPPAVHTVIDGKLYAWAGESGQEIWQPAKDLEIRSGKIEKKPDAQAQA